jgi:hypothetical protein
MAHEIIDVQRFEKTQGYFGIEGDDPPPGCARAIPEAD